MGQHRQRHVPVPTIPRADFVLVQTRQLLGLLKTLFHRPTSAGDLRELH